MNPALTIQFERAVNEYARWQAVPAEDRSDAPAWWWDTVLAAVDETATMPVEWCATLKRIPVILKHSLRERNSWRIRLGLVVG